MYERRTYVNGNFSHSVFNMKPYDPIYEGARLRAIRKMLGKTQQELAIILDINRVQVSQIERGEYNISKQVGLTLLDQYGITTDFLFLGRINTLNFDLAERLRPYLDKELERVAQKV